MPKSSSGKPAAKKTPAKKAASKAASKTAAKAVGKRGAKTAVAKKSATTRAKPAADNSSASEQISKRIVELGDWRGDALARMRQLIHEAEPQVVETWKWMGTPIWEHNGIICTGESYKDKVKLTFAKGASLKDPKRLFNSSLEGNARRALDIREGETVDAAAFKALVREAAALNTSGKKKATGKPSTQ